MIGYIYLSLLSNFIYDLPKQQVIKTLSELLPNLAIAEDLKVLKYLSQRPADMKGSVRLHFSFIHYRPLKKCPSWNYESFSIAL